MLYPRVKGGRIQDFRGDNKDGQNKKCANEQDKWDSL